MVTPPVPDRHNKQTRFLAGLAQGKSPADAAALTGVPLPTFYTWRTKHTRFREAWEKAAADGHTPSFPSPAQLAAINLEKPKSHWFWMPGGGPGIEQATARRPGDWVVMVLRSFDDDYPTDLVIYSIVQEQSPWLRHSEGRSDQPMPEGVEHPDYPLPAEYAERLPPKPRPSSG